MTPRSQPVDGIRVRLHTAAMSVLFDASGQWVPDTRGDGRGVRVSAHADSGFLVVSTWKAGTCVGTVRLLPDEAADLVAAISHSLAALAHDHPTSSFGSADPMVAKLEARLSALEQRLV
jgi:hypothetical protein